MEYSLECCQSTLVPQVDGGLGEEKKELFYFELLIFIVCFTYIYMTQLLIKTFIM
jgi:hypothetical protein